MMQSTEKVTVVEERRVGRFAEDFIMAGAAAAVSKSGAAPLERVKLLMQNQSELMKRGYLSHPYHGISGCFSRLVREEGFVSLWRGNSANVIRYFPTQAFNFAFKDYFQNVLGYTKENNNYLKSLLSNVATGSAAGATTSLFLYHLDYARTRLGMDAQNIKAGNQRRYKGLLDVYQKTLAVDGIAGLYRGFSVSIIGITVYRGLYFGMYDTLKPMLLVGPLKGKFIFSFLLGWTVTTCAGVIAYPFDTVRRRMMMTSGENAKYKSTVHAFQHIVRHEGFSALFRGVSANMLLGMAGAGVLALHTRWWNGIPFLQVCRRYQTVLSLLGTCWGINTDHRCRTKTTQDTNGEPK